MANISISDKKKVLLARKANLLQEIKYYSKRISDFHANKSVTSYYEDSSDSDCDFVVFDNGPSVSQLKLQQSHLKTSLQATRELTNLQLLQHEVNIMVEDPVIVDEPQVWEPGVWREVIAECRLDLVPFSITFHVHKPDAKFGAPSYRNLKVILSKPAHETELANSVLVHVKTPSDAVEVLRSYSCAHRSRRTTLARLAEKYPNLLFMEPLAEGGYILKCAGLLEVRWTLQNRWSPIAPFHHRMRFDLEYMDESYIKVITQYHRQLSDPSLETEERTALLSKIINTCLEARGPTQELYESMSDDPETAQTLRKRRTTLDQAITETAPKRKRDDGIMAPPKSLPKKSKAKGKENKVQSEVTDVNNASGRESVVSGKSKDSKNLKSGKESDVRKENAKITKEVKENEGSKENEKVGKEATDRDNVNAEDTSDNRYDIQSIKEMVNREDQKSAKVGETQYKKDTAVKSKKNNDMNENEKTTKEVSKIGNENAKSSKETDKKKDGEAKSAKQKDVKKDNVVKSKENAAIKENTQVRNSVAKSTKDNDDGTKSQRKVKNVPADNVQEGSDKITKPVDGDGNTNTNVASTKVPKKSTIDKNVEDGKKNSTKGSKKSIMPKPKDNVNDDSKEKGENIESTDIVNSDKGSATKAKAETRNKNTDVNKINENTEKNASKKVKKTDDIANIPAKKAKIDQTTKNNDANAKTTVNAKKSVTNINKPPKNLQKNNNLNQNAKTKNDVVKKDSTYTKNNETVQKVAEMNKILTNKPNDVTKSNVKNTENVPKNSINPKKSIIHDKVKNNDHNIKNNIQKALINNQDKVKIVKNNIENNKNINNGKFNQKFKLSTGNTKLGSVKKLSAGNTTKETSTDSKISKIPQSVTKVASVKKNPLRISPRKLSSNLKGISSVKKTIQKPITSIPRLLKKPVVKT